MKIELPKCIVEAGVEHHIYKIKNTCRLIILKIVRESLKDEYNDVLKDPFFSPILAINKYKLGYSWKVIHSFVCKLLNISKRHELWFLFAMKPLRFSMQEFYVVTCLICEANNKTDFVAWKDDKGFWSNLLKRNGYVSIKQIRLKLLKDCKNWWCVDRFRLVYLCVIHGFVMDKDKKIFIPHAYIRLVMDFDKMRKYQWGFHAYDMLLEKARYKLKNNIYVLDGFCYALQIWIMEPIPDIGSLFGRKYKEGGTSLRCQNWYGRGKVSYYGITALQYCTWKECGIYDTGNGDVIVHLKLQKG